MLNYFGHDLTPFLVNTWLTQSRALYRLGTLHPMAARQLWKAPHGKGTFIPAVKTHGRQVATHFCSGYLASTEARTLKSGWKPAARVAADPTSPLALERPPAPPIKAEQQRLSREPMPHHQAATASTGGALWRLVQHQRKQYAFTACTEGL